MIAMDRRLLPLPLRLAEIESRLDTLERLMSAPPARTPAARRPPDPIQRVIALVSDRLAVPRRRLLSPSRSASIAWARQVAIYLVRAHYGLSSPELGRRFRRTPGAVIRAIQHVSDLVATDPRRAAQVQALSTLVCSSPSPSSADSGAPGRAS